MLIALLAACLVTIRVRYGGGEHFPDRSGKPVLDASVIEQVAALPLPAGNIAVSKTGRVFFTFHPDASPPTKLAELVEGRAVPFPDETFQREHGGTWLDTPLGVRIDAHGRLWVLDHAGHGSRDAKLLAFDIERRALVREVHFERDIAPLGSHLNDLQISADGKRVYVAEASIFGKRPALIVVDVDTNRARRLLEGDVSVAPEPYYITVDDEPIEVLGLFAVRPGVDSIALDRKGEWLYFAAVTATKMYRVRTRDLNDPSLEPALLASRVEVFGDKTQSDGISIDEQGTLYLSDPEHDAVVAMRSDAKLETLLSDDKLRWPDGFSFGPEGWLYFTCSALQHVIMKSPDHVAAHAPYHIFRFKPGGTATPGH